MVFYHLFILALVQGITEFLPVSSSGHLALTHAITGHNDVDQMIMLDIAVHVGTLFAVLLYFRADFYKIAGGFFSFLRGGKSEKTALFLYILIGSVPVVIAGFIMHLFPMDWSRSLALIGWTTLLFGVLLGIADRAAVKFKTLEQMNIKTAFIIGLAQCLALVPGTSRSGITMTAARFLGFDRTQAARFSLLLGMVAIAGAGLIGGIDVVQTASSVFTISIVFAALIAFVSGVIAIHIMMKWLAKASFMPFVVYRIILGTALLFVAYL
jgi:undecaprenyl-diphosphatase